MGVLFSNPGENMKKMMEENGEKMAINQRNAQMKQRQLMLATQYARGKDLFMFFQAFYFTALFGGMMSLIKTKSPGGIIPLVPLSFVYAYQYDMYHGNKMERIRRDAEKLIETSPELFIPPVNNMLISEEEYKKLMKIDEKK